MKQLQLLHSLSNQSALVELTLVEQCSISGGSDIAGDIGYTLGNMAGYFFAAGPRLIRDAAVIGRFILLLL